MKTCCVCGLRKTAAAFHVNKAADDGLLASCKVCHTAYMASRRAADPVAFLLVGCKARAKKEGIPFDITSTDLPRPKFCPVLGICLNYNGTGRGYGAQDDAASIDRVRNELGYVRGNVNVVSWRANRAKAFLTPEELQRMAQFYARYL